VQSSCFFYKLLELLFDSVAFQSRARFGSAAQRRGVDDEFASGMARGYVPLRIHECFALRRTSARFLTVDKTESHNSQSCNAPHAKTRQGFLGGNVEGTQAVLNLAESRRSSRSAAAR
jgi:hypothetical protein